MQEASFPYEVVACFWAGWSFKIYSVASTFFVGIDFFSHYMCNVQCHLSENLKRQKLAKETRELK